jgi:hypothetical protein
LSLIKRLEIKNGFGCIVFVVEEGDTDESGVLVNKSEEVALAGVGGGGNGANEICMNDFKGVFSFVKVSFVRDTRNFALHAAVTGVGLGESDAGEHRLEKSNACMAHAMMPGLKSGCQKGVSGGEERGDFSGNWSDFALYLKDVIVVFAVKVDVAINENSNVMEGC